MVEANKARKTAMAEKIIATCNGVEGKTIAILGLAFKPNTDDMRDAPSLTIIPHLQQIGANIRAYDPEAMSEAKKLLQDIDYTSSAYDCIEGADAAVIITEWDEFRALDLARVKSLLKTPILIDLRNIYKLSAIRALGFTYSSVGRAAIN